MKTKLRKKNQLQALHGSITSLTENRDASMSALAELAIIISRDEVKQFFMLDGSISELLHSVHYLLTGLSNESTEQVLNFIMEQSIAIDSEDVKPLKNIELC
jgi:hypothetical protein